MKEMLSFERKITERPYMQYQPFGIDEKGRKIEEVRGHVIVSIIEYTKEQVIAKEVQSFKDLPLPLVKEIGERVAGEATERLVSMLNERIKDRKFHVTKELLQNPWNSYSTEFFQFMVEFAKELTGEEDFCLKLGMDKIITPLLAIIGKPIPLEYLYKMVDLEERFSKDVIRLEAPEITRGRAIIRINVMEKYREVVGEYFLACVKNTCQIRKGVLIAAPQRIHNVSPAQCKDIKCMLQGDEYCEIELTWETRPPVGRGFIFLGMVSSVALFFGLTFVIQCMALKLTLSMFPLLICYYLTNKWRLTEENLKKERLIAEQQKYLEDRFRDLEGVTIQLQATNIELSERLQQLSETQSQLKESLFETVRCLSEAIDTKSPWTKGHSERVATLSCDIARELGLKEEDVDSIRMAALLHDVGKIGIYEKLLDKPGKLTPEEWAVIKEHCAKGVQIIHPVKRFGELIPIILYHHERYDGKGYPEGKKGEEIPLGARILNVADAVDAMTSERPYRRAMSIKEAIQELRKNAGTQFCPKAVEAALKVLARRLLIPFRDL